MDCPTHELEAYFAGDPTEEQIRVVEAWINDDSANAREFMQQLHFRQLVGEHLRELRTDNRAVLAELARIEAAQHTDVVTLIDLDEQIRNQEKGSVNLADLKVAGGYLLRHYVTPKRLGYVGLAAVVLLGVSIFIALQGEKTPPTPTPFAQTPKDVEPIAPVKRIVAAITDTHDAVWSSDSAGGASGPAVAITPHTSLYAGDRLTLIAGFAEITTGRGTVATLEAPCTVDVIDDNVLRLSLGKLVANVPPKAIGFTVHTPTSDVIDYGTQFGVQVSKTGTTRAAVFVGEVELRELSSTPQAPTRNVRLTEGWASQVSHKGMLRHEPVPVSANDHVRFAKSIQEATSPSFAYRRAVLANKPLLYWGFDDSTPTTENLASNADWFGSAIGQTNRGQGVVGSALKLTGNSKTMNGFDGDNPLKLDTTDVYTLEAWYLADQPHWGRVLSLGLFDAAQQKSLAHLATIELLGGEVSQAFSEQTGLARFYHRGEPMQTSLNIFSKSPAPIGQWTHVVAVRDGETSRLYINGELVSEQNDLQTAITDASVTLLVGTTRTPYGQQKNAAKPGDFRAFNGLIDEVAVYGHALDAKQIASHYQLGTNTSPLSDD
ncbi:MAG: LamG-like jellyroll fold domain-containing protein [Phycisphaeraceae bacterium]